jgi:hypothetical protein
VVKERVRVLEEDWQEFMRVHTGVGIIRGINIAGAVGDRESNGAVLNESIRESAVLNHNEISESESNGESIRESTVLDEPNSESNGGLDESSGVPDKSNGGRVESQCPANGESQCPANGSRAQTSQNAPRDSSDSFLRCPSASSQHSIHSTRSIAEHTLSSMNIRMRNVFYKIQSNRFE